MKFNDLDVWQRGLYNLIVEELDGCPLSEGEITEVLEAVIEDEYGSGTWRARTLRD